MNLRSNFNRVLSDIKQLEGQYADRVKNGSQDPQDFHWMSYFNGMHNGFNFVWWVLDNNVTEKEFETVKRDMLNTEEKPN